MGAGDTSVQIVTAPIDATSVKVALDAAIAATSVGARCTVTSFNDGRGIVVTAIEV